MSIFISLTTAKFVNLSVYLYLIYLPVYFSNRLLSIGMFNCRYCCLMSLYLYVYFSIYLGSIFVHLSICLTVLLTSCQYFYPHICLSVYLSVCNFFCLSICPPAYLSIFCKFLFVYMSNNILIYLVWF